MRNDSLLWSELNNRWETIFLKTNQKWRDIALKQNSSLKIELYNIEGNSVEKALSGEIYYYDPPHILDNINFDIILIDGPPDYKANMPGRALPIIWVKELASPHTTIFLDDYERKLEKIFFDKYFPGSSQICVPKRGKNGTLAWYDPA